MKVCIFGAGAVGGHIALRCQLGGATTSVIARGAQLAAIRERGLRLIGPGIDLSTPVRAAEEPADLGVQDAVIVTVKAPALASVARSIAPLLGPETFVVFAMNGIPWWYFHKSGGDFDGLQLPTLDPDGLLWQTVGPKRAVGGVVYSASSLVEPGVVRLAKAQNRLVLGEPDATCTGRAEPLAAVLERGGLTTVVSPAIRDEIWGKHQNNVASGLMAILTQNAANDIAAEPACAEAMRALIGETIAVGNALGSQPAQDVERVIATMQGLAHKPSILQDLEAGRQMEVEALFTVVVRLARMTGTPTPMLDLLVAMSRLRARAAGLLDETAPPPAPPLAAPG